MSSSRPDTVAALVEGPADQARAQGSVGFPLAPLEAAAGHPSAAALALRLGVTRRTVNRWRRAGAVPARHADTVAVRLGHHPAEIWPTEWNAA